MDLREELIVGQALDKVESLLETLKELIEEKEESLSEEHPKSRMLEAMEVFIERRCEKVLIAVPLTIPRIGILDELSDGRFSYNYNKVKNVLNYRGVEFKFVSYGSEYDLCRLRGSRFDGVICQGLVDENVFQHLRWTAIDKLIIIV